MTFTRKSELEVFQDLNKLSSPATVKRHDADEVSFDVGCADPIGKKPDAIGAQALAQEPNLDVSVDIQVEFATIRDAVQRIKLQSDWRLNDNGKKLCTYNRSTSSCCHSMVSEVY